MQIAIVATICFFAALYLLRRLCRTLAGKGSCGCGCGGCSSRRSSSVLENCPSGTCASGTCPSTCSRTLPMAEPKVRS